ncbi:MAG TPA: nucleotidyltransferase domain-containing protein [Verrucomicrobiae bacterium]|nr:nucleotidyltransferase domain-containing protein [Verrucomicrobiae bacterium]
MSAEIPELLERAATELKAAGATEVYTFGSASKGTAGITSDLDLAVSGLPPSIFYRTAARLSELLGRSVDLIDLDRATPFTRYLRQEHELIRLG